MKKLFVITLAVAMVLSLSAVVFAAELPAAQTQAITVTYNAEDNTDTPVYGVNVAWTNTDCTYAYGKNWNPETLQYDTAVDADWSDAELTVTITNKSNVKLVSDVTFEGANGVTGTAAGDGEMAAATVGAAAAAQVVTITLDGDPTDLGVAAIGSIKVSFSAAQ